MLRDELGDDYFAEVQEHLKELKFRNGVLISAELGAGNKGTSLPVYFLLDEFRQLKKMDEIMTKLPYVAGYNIKLAIIIQDLKNLDEIYGETSRHSLLGNCGYQLILGANDQATADYASRALGKRTIRYQSESRTIELLGLPRRTKVEQIRERDLMMPQEIRQMPETKTVLLVEGQRPIFGDKLRFFETQPFKSAEALSQAHTPDVPPIEYLPIQPVPALTDDYAQAGQPAEDVGAPTTGMADSEKRMSSPVNGAEAMPTIAPTAKAATAIKKPGDRTVNRKASLPQPKRAKASSGGSGNEPEATADVATIDARIKIAEESLKPSAERLKETVSQKVEKLGQASPTKRRNYLDIFAATVPDPVELGLEAAEAQA
nr:type IV secretory system conjugative DNA transfer family protein [Mesorhizobium tianshanense]